MSQSGTKYKYCSQCGAPRRANAKVCARCGHRFVEAIAEKPIIQSDALAEPISQQVISTPRNGQPSPVFDLSGDPSPYVSDDELKRLRGVKPGRLENFRKFIRSLLGY